METTTKCAHCGKPVEVPESGTPIHESCMRERLQGYEAPKPSPTNLSRDENVIEE